MKLTKESFDDHFMFHNNLKEWVDENIEEIAKIHGKEFKGWIADIRFEETDMGTNEYKLYIRTEHGKSYEGYYDGEDYYLSPQFIYDREYRKAYAKKLADQRDEEQRLKDLKEKERIEVGLKMEMARYKKLHEKYGGKI